MYRGICTPPPPPEEDVPTATVNNTIDQSVTINNVTNNVTNIENIANVTNIANVANITNVTIQLRPFGEENLTYLKANDMIAKVNRFGHLEDMMVKALQMVHFNNEHPENRNVYMSNLRGRHVHTYDGSEFIAQPKEMVLEMLTESIRGVLEDMQGDMTDNRVIQNIDDIGEKIDDENKRFMQRLSARLESQLYNGRRKVETVSCIPLI
jgi:hypothetical protein